MAALLVITGELTRSTPFPSLPHFALGLAVVLATLQLVGLPVVQLRRQVPDHWRGRVDGQVLAWLYGLLLGTGFATAVMVSAFWVFLTMTLVVAPVVAFLGWAVYALTRGLGFWRISSRNGIEGMFLRPGQHQLLVVVATLIAVATVGIHADELVV
ncbi:MAG: hypothetical protein ACREON_00560 [Gemmatimonadaceae bacterium]